MTLCVCGCGKEIIIQKHHKYVGIPKYIRGHCRRGIHITEQHKQILRELNTGKICSEITKEKLSKINSGKNHPQYGKHRSEVTKEKIRKGNTGKHNSLESIEKNRKKHIGIKKTKETIEKISGKNSWNWQGGKSFEPYCEKFNNVLKEEIRKRDNYQCQNPYCLCTQIESMVLYSGTLHVHHVHYDKPNCDPDLIALCQSCNCKANYNRDYWEHLYMIVLKNRGLCK